MSNPLHLVQVHASSVCMRTLTGYPSGSKRRRALYYYKSPNIIITTGGRRRAGGGGEGGVNDKADDKKEEEEEERSLAVRDPANDCHDKSLTGILEAEPAKP
ncbi:unnamed protein product [Sphagnum balticum]